jgi:hypothetical protein
MNFQVVVRDNRAGGGSIVSALTTLNVDGASGPFVITAPDTGVAWTGGSAQMVTWNVANTANAPVSAANVKISLSMDGGNTFPISVIATTPNDGSETINVPNFNTTQARIKVEAINNIFFDISGADFTINAVSGATVSGRVVTSNNKGIPGARVTVTGPNGYEQIVRADRQGNYIVSNLPPGATYNFTVKANRYVFNNPYVLTVNNNVSGYNFAAN